MPTLAGTKLDKYDMLEEVGHGGMAVVYRALDGTLHREVAVKVLHAHLADREESRLRLQREAIAVAKLRHENILEIFDYSGTQAGESYIVTEFIHGPTLREWLDDDYTPRPAVAALVVHRLTLALMHAHKGGIVHRDIKPENVMIRREDGCIKLMDFGIAQILDNQKLTMTGQLIGSPAYMAPELINGRALDARTDLFSLGILLYQLATGALPFTGRNPHEVLNRIADGNYPAPSTVCPLVDKDLESIIAKALATNPDERHQSAETLARELELYLREMGVEPTAEELRGYFRDAKGYLVELDQRVSKTLMGQAERAAREGMHGRAIRLLCRVLEHDKEHREARAMLARLRVRERRMRQLLLAGAALGALGLVAAAFVLVPDPMRESLQLHDAHAAGATPATPTPAAVAADAAPLQSDPGPSDATDDAAALVDFDPTTAVVPTPTPTTAGADDSGGRTRPEPGTRPVRTPPPPRAPTKTDCVVLLGGVPLPTAKNLKLHITPRDGSVASARPIDALELPIEFAGTEATLTISDRGWTASRAVRRDECERGTVSLTVMPKPAKISFNFSGGASKLVVTCKSGCPEDLIGADKMASAFPSIRFDPDTTKRQVRLEFNAEGYVPGEAPYELHPGVNTIEVKLQPRGSG